MIAILTSLLVAGSGMPGCDVSIGYGDTPSCSNIQPTSHAALRQ